MELKIVPVNGVNRAEAEQLSVAENQKNFIEPVAECLGEADKNPDWEPVCIYDGDKMIGFAMYGYMSREKNPTVWFDRFLIDQRYQRHGYGRCAAETILKRIEAEFPGKNIYLSAYEDNKVAISLYESFGFHMNGAIDINGEKVMVLDIENN